MWHRKWRKIRSTEKKQKKEDKEEKQIGYKKLAGIFHRMVQSLLELVWRQIIVMMIVSLEFHFFLSKVEV